jgi:ubiquitin carboxyl-terminal hydrolase L5
MFNEWCTIESDPGVFTELVKKMGAPGVQVEEVYSLEDDDLITRLQPEIYGFIFLFKWSKDIEKKDYLLDYDRDLFFARQVVNNACATQAILAILLNAPIELSGCLKEFHEFTKDLPPEDRGLCLSNSDSIRKLHNSFSRPEPFIFKEDKRKKKKEADIYHFVSYVPHKGHLYELDGLQPGPILIGKYDQPRDWIPLAQREIQSRLQSFGQEIRFNLMVVCEDLKIKAQREIEVCRLERAGIAKAFRSMGRAYDAAVIEQFPDAEASVEQDPTKLAVRN